MMLQHIAAYAVCKVLEDVHSWSRNHISTGPTSVPPQSDITMYFTWNTDSTYCIYHQKTQYCIINLELQNKFTWFQDHNNQKTSCVTVKLYNIYCCWTESTQPWYIWYCKASAVYGMILKKCDLQSEAILLFFFKFFKSLMYIRLLSSFNLHKTNQLVQ